MKFDWDSNEEKKRTAEMVKLAQELREKYRDVPVSIKMSRETYRLFIVEHNILPGNEPTGLFGMPIIFDDVIPIGEFREQARLFPFQERMIEEVMQRKHVLPDLPPGYGKTLRIGMEKAPEAAMNFPVCEGNDFLPIMSEQFESRILRTLQIPRVFIIGSDESTSSAVIAQVMQKINDESVREIGRTTARMLEQLLIPPLLEVISHGSFSGEVVFDQIAWLKMIGKVSPKCERRRIGRAIRTLRGRFKRGI